MGFRVRVAVVAEDARVSRALTAAARSAGHRVTSVRDLSPRSGPRLAACDLAIAAEPSVAALRRVAPLVPLVAVVADPDQRTVAALLRQRVAGIVAESKLATTLAPTILAVASGQLCVPGTFTAAAERPHLSVREKQVLGMVVLGFANLEIAQRLVLAESTVKSHLNSAFRKMGVRTRVEAADLILDPRNGLGTGILTIPTAEPVA